MQNVFQKVCKNTDFFETILSGILVILDMNVSFDS